MKKQINWHLKKNLKIKCSKVAFKINKLSSQLNPKSSFFRSKAILNDDLFLEVSILIQYHILSTHQLSNIFKIFLCICLLSPLG